MQTTNPGSVPGEGPIRFRLCPEGLPLPARYHAIALAMSLGVMVAGFALQATLEDVLAGGWLAWFEWHESIGMLGFALAIGVYWGLRKHMESRLFVPGSAVVIEGDRLVIPGFLAGRRDDVLLAPDQVVGIVLREQVREIRSGEKMWTLVLRTSTLGDLVFWDSALQEDLEAFARSLENFSGKTHVIERSWHVSPWRVIGGVVIVIGGCAVGMLLLVEVATALR